MLPTVDQLEMINRFFASKSLDPKCSICGCDDWAVEDIIPAVDHPGPKILRRGAMVPLLQLECQNCGHVVFFNAVTLGLIPDDGKV